MKKNKKVLEQTSEPFIVKHSFFIGIFIIFIITLVMFGPVIFTARDIILSSYGTDLTNQFLGWRKFGFGELRKGNLPLWCPHIYSGMPYMGGFQSALLYPLNVFYLFLPLSKAINVTIALHIFLGGLFMYLWAGSRNLHISARILSSLLFMFCGSHFLHLYPGHLPNLCTMIWAPLIFYSIDGWFEHASPKWIFTGIVAIALQIYGGHPQYVFYTFMTVIVYSFFSLLKSEKRLQKIAGIFIMYISSALLSAVQLFTGLQATSESLRSGSVTYRFACEHSFPPENFLTLFCPGIFGNMVNFNYWGRSYFWETCIFMSVTGLILAIYGLIYGEKEKLKSSLPVILVIIIFALGSNTPLFKFLYYFIPGFNKFRGTAKFIFFASLFFIILSGIGFDHLLNNHHKLSRKFIFSLLSGGIFMTIIALFTGFSSKSAWWHNFMIFINNSDVSRPRSDYFIASEFVRDGALFAFKGLMGTALFILFLSLCFYFASKYRKAVYFIAFLSVMEILFFAWTFLPSFDLEKTYFSQIENFLASRPGDYRVLQFINPNSSLYTGMKDIWGHDPGAIKRYAEFMAFTQKKDPNDVAEYFQFSGIHPLYRMLRCRYVFALQGGEIRISELENPMAQLQLIDEYTVMGERDKIFSALNDPSFNPEKTLILEKEPEIKPVKSHFMGDVKIISSSTDSMTIEANLKEPKILLITDTYSKYWVCTPLEGTCQNNYDVMPANYILRAIPLSGGKHLFRIEYRPSLFYHGFIITIVSIFIYFIIIIIYYKYLRTTEGKKL